MHKIQLGMISTHEVVSVTPEAQITNVLELMRSKHISCIVVLEDRFPVGIVTERSLVNLAAHKNCSFVDCPIVEIMSAPVMTAREDMDLFDAYRMFSAKGMRHLVVVDPEGHVVGLLTQSDIVRHLGYDAFLEVKRVSQSMSKVVFSVTADVLLQTAIESMSEKSLSCLIIAKDGQPCGIITERDVAKFLIGYDDISQVTVGQVMTSPVETVEGDTLLPIAVELMKKKELRRLVVVNRENKIIGLTTLSDIIKGLEGRYIDSLHEKIKQKDTALKQTSTKLAEKTVHLDNILNSSIDYGIIATDLKYRVIYFNPGAERILGIIAEHVIAKDIREIHKLHRADFLKVDEVLDGIRNGQRQSFVIQRQNNEGIQHINANASGIFDKDSNLLGFFLMVNDITMQIQAEQDLRCAHDALEQRVQERTAQLAKAMNGAIQAVAMTVETRDPYTSGHQRRVADLAQAIAKEMDLPQDIVEGVYMSGVIHDIGKIRVPSEILCHPGHLSVSEFSILKQHPQIGTNILKGIDLPWPVAVTIHQHHERMDGSGYPLGLKGNEISLMARIITVADVVEAMSSHRPYRPALGIERALDEIYRNRGILYDHEVADVCLTLFREKQYCFPTLLDSTDNRFFD